MFKDWSESSSFKKREKLRTVPEMSEVETPVVTKILKIALSDLFKGERSRFKPFLLQVEMNICFNKLQFKTDTDKVLYTVTYL